MRILICHPSVPFMKGGSEKQATGIYKELLKRNHKVELIEIPFKWYPPFKILDSVITWRLLDLTEYNGKKIDLVISTKFPSYVIEHPNHVVWLTHQHRPAYDLRNTKYDDLQYNPDGQYVREKITEIDNNYLRKVKKVFTISKNVSKRLQKFNQIESESLYIPIPNSEKFHSKDYGDYVIFPSRISPLKRQDLLVEAMKYTKTDVKCKIVGFDAHEKWLENILKDNNQHDKIELISNASDDELIDLYSRALAVVYVPIDEDYGIVTLEAFYSEKLVITATDSGGTLEFVKDGINGFIVNPDPKKIAEKLDELYNDKEKAAKMGKAALQTIDELNLNWDFVIEKLIK